MFKFLKQNKNILMVAFGLFIVSMSTLLFFLKEDPHTGKLNEDLKTSVVESVSMKSHQEDEKIYRDITKNSDDGIIVIKINGMVDFVSWNLEEIAGYREDDIKGTLFFKMISPQDLSTFLEAFGKVIDKEAPLSLVGPYRIQNSNGEFHYYIGSMHPISWNGKIAKIALTLRDINETVEDGETSEQDEKHYPGKRIRDEKENKDSLDNKIANNKV